MNFPIKRITIYPVKSLGGIDVQQALCLDTGLKYDREWVVTDQQGRFVTQRQIPKMASIQLTMEEQHLVFSREGHGSYYLPLEHKSESSIQVRVWQDECLGFDEGTEVSQWLNSALGVSDSEPLKLVRFNKTAQRHVRDKYTSNSDAVLLFADACPFLIVNEASLQKLNHLLSKNALAAVDINRFRGNIQVDSDVAWQEYQWRDIWIGDIYLRGEGPCQRCQMTTIDQCTGEIKEPGQPLKTLVDLNEPVDFKGAFFGQHATLLKGHQQSISLGDLLRVG